MFIFPKLNQSLYCLKTLYNLKTIEPTDLKQVIVYLCHRYCHILSIDSWFLQNECASYPDCGTEADALTGFQLVSPSGQNVCLPILSFTVADAALLFKPN